MKNNKAGWLIKKIDIWKGIYALLFALMMTLSAHVIDASGDDTGNVQNIYFTDLHLIDLAIWLALALLFYFILRSLPKLKPSAFYGEARGKDIKALGAIGLTILVAWLPYIFSYWPGGVYTDTVNSLLIATGENAMSTHEPILYTCLWCILFKLTGGSLEVGHYGGLYAFTLLQFAAMLCLLAAFVYWNYKRGLKKNLTVILTLIFALFPLFPLYAVSLWKDTPFGVIVFLYSWQLFIMNERMDKEGGISRKDLIKYIALTIFTVFGRNNGIYVVIFVSLVGTLLLLKKKNLMKKFALASFITIAACLIIQHPVFSAMGLNVDTVVESAGIPLQQTAYIVATDGRVSDSDRELIEEIIPIDTLKSVYDPMDADLIKFDASFDREFFAEHFSEFMGVYVRLCLKNPVKAVKGYLLATLDFWDVWESSGVAYVCPTCGGWSGIYQGDFFAYYTGVSFAELVTPGTYISPAVTAWLVLLAFVLVMAGKNKRNILPLMPGLGVWLTIMVAVPIAFSFRYVFAVFLCIPIYLLVLIRDGGQNEESL